MTSANQIQRRTALSLGNVVGNRNKLANKKLDDIKEDWEAGDTTLINQIRYFGKSLDGSPQYFYSKSIDSLVGHFALTIGKFVNFYTLSFQAYCKFVRLRSGDTEAFNAFFTFSCPGKVFVIKNYSIFLKDTSSS